MGEIQDNIFQGLGKMMFQDDTFKKIILLKDIKMNNNNPFSSKLIYNSYITYKNIYNFAKSFYYMNNEKKNSFANFHIKQSLGLWLTYMIIGYVQGYFDNWMITTSFLVFFGVLFLFGIVNAISGKAIPVPLVGNFYQKIFAKLGA